MVKKEFDFDASQHSLVPKHSKLSEKDKEKLFEKYRITGFNLPKILSSDPAIKEFEVETGDVIKIERKSVTAGKSVYYRVVV